MNELRLLYFDSWPSPPGFKVLPGKSKWFSNGTQYLPSKLQWLSWNRYPSDSLPEDFQAEVLVRLEMRSGNMIQLWKESKNLENLRLTNLAFSSKLEKIPDLKGVPKLETLILDTCLSLVEVHQSVGELERLVFLSLKRCRNLINLPSRIRMKSLKTLVLSKCSKLKHFPGIVEKMDSLSKLYLNGTSIEELPPSIGKFSGLLLMDLSECAHLTSLPSTIGNLKCLRNLKLYDCARLERLPEPMGHIRFLEELYLDRSPIRVAPSSIVLLKNLETLSMDGCHELMSSLLLPSYHSSNLGLDLPPLLRFTCIKKLLAKNCKLSEGNIPDDLSPLFSLEEIELSRNAFTYLPASICQLPRLKLLDVSHCPKLELSELPSSIATLYADGVRPFKSFRTLFRKCESLCKLSVVGTLAGMDKPIYKVLQFLLQGHLVANHRWNIAVSGNIIPEWFNEQHPGNYTFFQLPLNWYNESFLGFAICAVLERNLHSHSYMNIQLTFIDESTFINEGENEPTTRTPYLTDFPIDAFKRYKEKVWLGFMSSDFFQLLFPKVKPDDWSNFHGYLSARFSYYSHEPYSYEILKCAIRPVYKEDVERVPTVQSSAVSSSDPLGRPWLHYDLEDDKDDDKDEYIKSEHILLSDMVYLRETGHNHAALRWTF